MSVSSKVFLMMGLFGVVAVLGCGGSSGDQPELGMVTGKVTMDGQPLPNVRVTFTPKDGRPSVGETNEAGEYTLRYIRDIMGAKPGSHTVKITTIYETTSDRDGGKAPKETIPAEYNAQSTLQKEVTLGDNEIHFPLTSS